MTASDVQRRDAVRRAADRAIDDRDVAPLTALVRSLSSADVANPFNTTFVDATGLLIYFLIAMAVLGL